MRKASEKSGKGNTFEQFVNSTTLHGIKHSFDKESHIAKRAVWFFFLLLMVGVYTCLAVISIMKYYRFESGTKMSIVATKDLTFPAVSICHINQFSKMLIQNDSTLEYWMTRLENQQPESLNETEREEARASLQRHIMWHVFGLLIPGVLKRCYFGGLEFPCYDQFTPRMSETSMCLTFKEKYGTKITQTGFEYGLRVWIDTKLDNYFIASSPGLGMKVVVHDATREPRLNEMASMIAPGTEAYISIERNIVQNLPKPYSEVQCMEGDDLNKYKYKSRSYFPHYSFESCMLDCMLYYAFEKCGCSFDGFSDACTLADYYFCIKHKRTTYFRKCDCQYPCKQRQYSRSVGLLPLSPLDSQRFIDSHNDTYATVEDFTRNMIFLNVYYPALQYREIKQIKSFTFDELVSNLGGQLGLFLGASVLTMGEILDYLFKYCYYTLIKSKSELKK